MNDTMAWRFLYLFVVASVVLIFKMTDPVGATIARTVVLSKADKATLNQVENYLNNLTTLQARFLQRASSGEQEQGTLYLARPKRMRIEYDPPNPNLLISDGTYLTFVDRELDNATTIYLSMTPADLILRDKLSFSGPEIIVTGFQQEKGVIRIAMVKADDPLAGRLTLVLTARPIALKKWSVLDAQGVTTKISLSNVRMGGKMDAALFRYEAKDKDADLN